MNSRIYRGLVRHQRYYPTEHAFRYRVFMMYLDLDELPQLFDGHSLWSARGPSVAWFRRKDHLGDPEKPLDEAVRQLVQDELGRRPGGSIRLLTHLRYFGYCMNPVSFYYCWNREEESLDAIIAEVNNTPWGERHCQVLDCRRAKYINDRWYFELRKAFHVSPFMSMNQDYVWRFSQPDELLTVAMDSIEEKRHLFSATLALRAEPITSAALANVLGRYPFMTGKVIAAIYWQALRLWLKGAPFYQHPKHLKKTPLELGQ